MQREYLIQKIKELFFSEKSNNRLSYNTLKNKYPTLIDELFSQTSFLPVDKKLDERIHCLLNNITELKICPVCKQGILKYHKSLRGYARTCSRKCVLPATIEKSQKTLIQKGLPLIGSKEFKSKAKETNKIKYNDENYNNRTKAKLSYIKKYGVSNPFLSPDIRKKSEETCLKKYGVSNPFSCTESRKKAEETCLKKYGDNHYTKTEECKNKIRSTCQEKYGTDNVLQADSIQNKIQETCLKKYGVSNPFSCTESRKKAEETCLKKYGVSNPSKSDIIQNKIQETCLKKYNKEHYSQTDEYREKFKKTCLTKYNADSPFSATQIRNKITQTFLNNYGVPYPSSKEITQKAKLTYQKNHPEYNISIDKLRTLYKEKPATEIAKILKVSDITINNRLRQHGLPIIPHRKTSTHENEIKYFIKQNYKDKIIEKDRTVIKPKELDIYLPNINLALEINGAYYHSSKFVDKYHHYNKSIDCLAKNIQLIHIFDYQWLNEKEKIQSFILNKLGKSQRIFARKCQIKLVNKEDSEKFYSINHLQGYANSKINIGLYYQNDLVSLMSFSKARFDRRYDWELTHFCTKLYHQVVGGASKLFNYFVREYDPKNIITYCNLLYSVGSLYEQMGFKKIRTIQPNYSYIKNNKIYSKLYFKKKYFPEELQQYTETEITRALKAYKIYDAGKFVYVWTSQVS